MNSKRTRDEDQALAGEKRPRQARTTRVKRSLDSDPAPLLTDYPPANSPNARVVQDHLGLHNAEFMLTHNSTASSPREREVVQDQGLGIAKFMHPVDPDELEIQRLKQELQSNEQRLQQLLHKQRQKKDKESRAAAVAIARKWPQLIQYDPLYAPHTRQLEQESSGFARSSAKHIVKCLQSALDECPSALLELDLTALGEIWSPAKEAIEEVRRRHAELKYDIEAFKELMRQMWGNNFAK